MVLIFFIKASEWLISFRTFLQNHSENQYHTIAIFLRVTHNQGICVGVFLGMTLQECARLVEPFRSLNGQKYTHTYAEHLCYDTATSSNLFNYTINETVPSASICLNIFSYSQFNSEFVGNLLALFYFFFGNYINNRKNNLVYYIFCIFCKFKHCIKRLLAKA